MEKNTVVRLVLIPLRELGRRIVAHALTRSARAQWLRKQSLLLARRYEYVLLLHLYHLIFMPN